MHELLLFAQVPPDRHALVLQLLSGIAAMKPARVLERHLIFKPRKGDFADVRTAARPQLEVVKPLLEQLRGAPYHLQLIGEVSAQAFSEVDDVVMVDDDAELESLPKNYDFEKQIWSLKFYDQPEVAKTRPVTSRLLFSVDRLENKAFELLNAMKYDFQTEYLIDGQQVVHNNVVINLQRLLRMPSSTSESIGPHKVLPPLSSFELLDGSGTYLLQASVRVSDGSKPELMATGVKELIHIRDMLKSVVDLKPGDRLAMDTRVKS